jgi:lambda repressor-like predicted transcriptional regulator
MRMNRLPLTKRVQILAMLREGSSMRSISRVSEISINTVYKLLAAAGPVCTRFHDAAVRGVASQHFQCDEAWAFCYSKQKNVATAKAAPEGAGDAWTWIALGSDSKLILLWTVGGRDAGYASRDPTRARWGDQPNRQLGGNSRNGPHFPAGLCSASPRP